MGFTVLRDNSLGIKLLGNGVPESSTTHLSRARSYDALVQVLENADVDCKRFRQKFIAQPYLACFRALLAGLANVTA